MAKRFIKLFLTRTAVWDDVMLSADGDLSFADGATVRVDAAVFESGAMAAYGQSGLPLATATGTLSGMPALDSSSVPAGWYLVKHGGTLLFKHQQPFVMVVR